METLTTRETENSDFKINKLLIIKLIRTLEQKKQTHAHPKPNYTRIAQPKSITKL